MDCKTDLRPQRSGIESRAYFETESMKRAGTAKYGRSSVAKMQMRAERFNWNFETTIEREMCVLVCAT